MNILLMGYVRTGDADLLPECNAQAALPYATGGSASALWMPSRLGRQLAAGYTMAHWVCA
jgi:hypothetical protein